MIKHVLAKLTVGTLSLVMISCAPSSRKYESKYKLEPASGLYSVEEFRSQVDKWINTPYFEPANFGIYIEKPETRKIIYSKNAHKLFMPASNMKLFTTASALSLLGAEYRYETELYIDGEIQDSILNGNLIIRASGDPTISGRHYNGDALKVFRDWANILKNNGIKSINGSIIGDDNTFDDIGIGYGWAWDDLSYYYAAQVSALSFNDNCIDLYMMPSEQAGDTAIISYSPETNYVKIINELITVPADSQKVIDFCRYPGTNKIRIFGTIPVDSDTVIDWAAVDNPTLFTLTVFKETLEKCGIAAKKVCDIDDLNSEISPYSQLKLIHTHKSVPMSEIIRVINKSSHNLYAEQVLKTIGYEMKRKGDWESGISSEKKWLSSIGIDAHDIFIVDGSGLSRHNMVTPFQIATVLREMRYHSDWEVFFNSLPIAGVDGTIENRFKGSNALGHVFAKTGYIGHVRSLSGYLFAKDGSEYIFSLMVNHYPVPTSAVNDVQDAIVTLLYNLVE